VAARPHTCGMRACAYVCRRTTPAAGAASRRAIGMTSRRATSSRKCGPCASRPRPQHCAPSCRPRKISCPLPSPLDLLCDLSRVRGEADGSGQFLAPPLGRHLEQVPSTTMYTHSPKCFQINCSWKNPSRINQNPPFCLFPKYRVSTVAVMFECEFHGLACVA
jgi:hypothetical protein